jgi:hypothetical protein
MSTPSITARLGSEPISRARVLDWEDRRITAAARKLGVPSPPGDIAARREQLLQAKLALGPDEISARFTKEARLAELVARMEAGVSKRRRPSVIDLYVGGGTAKRFVDDFEGWSATSDEAAMLRACPDHFVIRTRPDGRQEVLETTGGSPLPSLFVIDYDDVASLVTQADPQFPYQIAGVARASNGAAIGGVRHQFRDTEDGFHARLTVEFPLPTIGRMVAGHRWHLACEFSNWIEAAATRQHP